MRVLIAIPHQSEYTHQLFNKSLRELCTELDGLSFPYQVFEQERNLPDVARNNAVLEAFDIGATHILFIDDDMVFRSNLLSYLAMGHRDIIGALTWQRKPPYYPSIYRYNPKKEGLSGDWDSIVAPEIQLPSINSSYKPTDKIWEVDAIGLAATLCNIKVFQKMQVPFFKFGREGGEDLSFCKRAKEAGFKIYCKPSVRVGHITNQIIDFKNSEYAIEWLQFLGKFNKKNGSKFKPYT